MLKWKISLFSFSVSPKQNENKTEIEKSPSRHCKLFPFGFCEKQFRVRAKSWEARLSLSAGPLWRSWVRSMKRNKIWFNFAPCVGGKWLRSYLDVNVLLDASRRLRVVNLRFRLFLDEHLRLRERRISMLRQGFRPRNSPLILMRSSFVRKAAQLFPRLILNQSFRLFLIRVAKRIVNKNYRK